MRQRLCVCLVFWSGPFYNIHVWEGRGGGGNLPRSPGQVLQSVPCDLFQKESPSQTFCCFAYLKLFHNKRQTFPQPPRGMLQIRGPFALMTVFEYLERLFV